MIRHLYIHIPFCHRICPYCGFYKHLPGRADYPGFVQALARELAWAAERWQILPETVSAGGGTPSLLPARVWTGFAQELRQRVDLTAVREWTVEANPRTFNADKAQAWRESGVTRVSLGVQSFDEGVLRTLGRDHGAADAERGCELLRQAGFADVNVDLMFAVPGQTLVSWADTLDRALSLRPSHVSAYNLTYEEDTDFLRKLEAGAWSQDADRDAGYFVLAHEKLTGAGFAHYEVSNYAQPGFRSVHNQAYWRGEDYLGLGPSAVSTIQGMRFTNWRDTAEYRRQVAAVGHGRVEEEAISEEDRRLERLALGLRTREGIPVDVADADRVALLEGEGLAERDGDRLRLTLRGMMVADDVAGYLI